MYTKSYEEKRNITSTIHFCWCQLLRFVHALRWKIQDWTSQHLFNTGSALAVKGRNRRKRSIYHENYHNFIEDLNKKTMWHKDVCPYLFLFLSRETLWNLKIHFPVTFHLPSSSHPSSRLGPSHGVFCSSLQLKKPKPRELLKLFTVPLKTSPELGEAFKKEKRTGEMICKS